MRPRILFLDFDGVLNSGPYMRAWLKKYSLVDEERTSQEERFQHDAEKIDERAIVRLNRIVQATGARVVVCSSWRHFHPLGRLRKLLSARGFRGTVVDVTPAIPNALRGAECAGWIAARRQPVWSFAALDDDNDYKPILGRLIKTSQRNYRHDGLRDKHVDAAIQLLRSPAAEEIASWRAEARRLMRRAVPIIPPKKLLPSWESRAFVDAMYAAHGYSNVVQISA